MAKFFDVKNLLEEKGIDYKVIELPDTAVSVDDVIRLTNGQVKEEEIIKTLIGKMNGQFMAFLLKGRDRLNTKIAGFERLATKEEVFEVAGVEPGAVCPILINIPVIIDQKVMQQQRVNMGSGDHLKGLEMNLEDLLKFLPAYRIEELT